MPHANNLANRTPSINTVTVFSGGLIAGTSSGICVLFERTEDSYLYKKSKEFLLEESSVHCIALNPSEDMAICTLSNSQIYTFNLDADSSKVRRIYFFSASLPILPHHVLVLHNHSLIRVKKSNAIAFASHFIMETLLEWTHVQGNH